MQSKQCLKLGPRDLRRLALLSKLTCLLTSRIHPVKIILTVVTVVIRAQHRQTTRAPPRTPTTNQPIATRGTLDNHRLRSQTPILW